MRLKRVRYPNGPYVHYTYGTTEGLDDMISRVAAIKNDNGGSPGATAFAAYSYDGAGRVVVEDYPQPDVRLDLVDVATWANTPGTYAGLDRFGRIRQQWWRDYGAAADVVKHQHAYDRNSNRLYRDDLVADAASRKLDELYAYDRLNRLVDFKRGGLNANKDAIAAGSQNRRRGEQWGLSDTGNWTDYQVDVAGDSGFADGDYAETGDLDQDRTHNQANEIWNSTPADAITETAGQTAWASPAHDARGNMTTIPRPNDPANAYTCTYDAWNRQVKVQTDDETPVTVAEYRYDGLHRRIAKLVPDANWDRTDFYYTRSWQVVEECFADDVATANRDNVATAAKHQYVWSLRYIDACVLRDEDKNSDGDCTDAGDERLYYCNGANMSVFALVDDAGDVQERYTYTPYGQPTIHDNDWSDTLTWANSKHNEILYSGYRYDGETGLYHVRFRMYHPTLGRWGQKDKEGYIEGMSMREYVIGNPLGRVDPVGAASRATGAVGSRSNPITSSMVEQWASNAEAESRQHFARYWELHWDARNKEEAAKHLRLSNKFSSKAFDLTSRAGNLCNREGAKSGWARAYDDEEAEEAGVSDREHGVYLSPGSVSPDQASGDMAILTAAAVMAEMPTGRGGLEKTLGAQLGIPGPKPGEAAAAIGKLMLRYDTLSKNRYGVWVRVQCMVCTLRKKDGKYVLAWADDGSPKWAKCDLTKTFLKNREMGGYMLNGLGTNQVLRKKSDLEKLHAQCAAQAKDHCK